MPLLKCPASDEAEPPANVDESKDDIKSETLKCRRSLRAKSKNSEAETSSMPEEESVKKTVKRKQPAKKASPTKSPKPRSRKKPIEQQESEDSQADVLQMDVKMEQLERMIDEATDEEDIEEGEIPNNIAADSLAAESRTFYSCKLCHKDFTSAFILYLHLQIHEKVANTTTTEDESPTVAEEECETKTVKLEEVYEGDTIADVECETKTVKLEKIYEGDTIAKVEEVEEVEQASTEDESVGLSSKNFVENLKRNLSLAMARNNL